MRRAFIQRVELALADEPLGTALDANADRRQHSRVVAFESLTDAEEKIQRAHAIRQNTIQNLDMFLGQFSAALQANGFQVHRAEGAADACRLILQIAQEAGARRVVKSKSMVTEEIRLNRALEDAGLEVLETDLGEYIVQLRGEAPGHIITPAIHLTRQDVGRTFHEKLGVPYTDDVAELNQFARKTLRPAFIDADLGISGANFGIAETGTICLVTNEGNGRMVTSLPPVHIAVMGIERIVPTPGDLDLMLQLLPRSATGQKLTSYVSLLGGSASPDSFTDSPRRHVILVDNGRRVLRGTPLEETLLCIRCGACLNACPVFREIGGHAYGSPYPGPIGSLVSPGYFGMELFGHLAHASTLCGACNEVCPVGIDLVGLLLRTRRMYRANTGGSMGLRLGLKIYTWLAASARRFRTAQRLGSLITRPIHPPGSWIKRLPPPISAWTRARDFPPFHSPRTLIPPPPIDQSPAPTMELKSAEMKSAPGEPDLIDRFTQELDALGGETIPCTSAEIGQRLRSRLGQSEERCILYEEAGVEGLAEGLRAAGFELMHSRPDPPVAGLDRKERLHCFDRCRVGLTGAIAGLANTGTLIVAHAGDGSLGSLLPEVHVAVLPRSRLFRSFGEWLHAHGADRLASGGSFVLISGPSRTADIEMTLTIGVHGPGRLIVFCLLDL